MRNFNWTRVGTLYQNEAKYALVSIFDKDTIDPGILNRNRYEYKQ